MRRVRCAVAMTLDGYIAGPKGESDWILIGSGDRLRCFGELVRHNAVGSEDLRGGAAAGWRPSNARA